MAAINKRQAEGVVGTMPVPKLRPADDVVIVGHEDFARDADIIVRRRYFRYHTYNP